MVERLKMDSTSVANKNFGFVLAEFVGCEILDFRQVGRIDDRTLLFPKWHNRICRWNWYRRSDLGLKSYTAFPLSGNEGRRDLQYGKLAAVNFFDAYLFYPDPTRR